MRIRTVSFGWAFLLIASLHGQDSSSLSQTKVELPVPDEVLFAETIHPEELREHVYLLASDSLEGRETGSAGIDKAAAYIASQFNSAGIAPVPGLNGYFQEVAFTRLKWDTIGMSTADRKWKHMSDFFSPPLQFPSDAFEAVSDQVLFLGYGIDAESYSDYDGTDVSGKIILIYNGEPFDKDGISYVTGSSSASAWSNGFDLKLKAAKDHGAKAVLVIQENLLKKVNEQRRFILRGRTIMGDGLAYKDRYAPYFEISTTLAESILGKKRRKVIRQRKRIGKKGDYKPVDIPVDLHIAARRQRITTPGSNVLGFVEGSDPDKRHELVILTAHYDHLGIRGDEIFYGADDNASGTAALIEVAEAFSVAKIAGKGPARSVLCMLVTGEEKGLLGSRYYTENPVFPLEQTVANINIDMIGRTDDKHQNENYVYVIGSDRLSSTLHEINEHVNTAFTKLDLDYTYNAADDPNQFYYRSDHYNFTRLGIPAIFYFSGTHEDYHRPTDTPDKLNYEKTATIAKLAFHVAWELANRAERIVVDVEE